MKSGAARWVGASAAVVLAAAIYYLPAHRRPVFPAAAPVPTTPPPGITLQVRTGGAPYSQVLAEAEVIFADPKGMTLYVYDKDARAGRPVCTDDCTKTWTPAIAPAGAISDRAWSLIGRPDGTRQWAYRGAPLYRFKNDRAIGDTTGDGADGGVWHAAAFRPGAGMLLPDNVGVREIPDAGGAGLADSQGITLYHFDGDASHPAPRCDGAGPCARHWHALEAPQIAGPVGEFTVIARQDGITQWAFRGRPLYQYDEDQRPGDAKGLGVDPRFEVALIVRHFMPSNVTIRRTASLGTLLTTTSLRTLYQRDIVTSDESHNFRMDHGSPALGRSLGTAACDAACEKDWRPFIAPADAIPTGYWDVIERADGARQWAYKGFALYLYAGDRPGDLNGNRIYDLAQTYDEAARPPGKAATAGVAGAAAEPTGSSAASPGHGIGAMFWHAVVP